MNDVVAKTKALWSNIVSLFREKNWQGVFRMVIFLFLTLAIFSTFSLSRQAGLNNINNLIYGVLLLIVLFYILIYGRIVFDQFFVLISGLNLIFILSSIINWKFNSQNTTLLLLSVTVFILYQYLIADKRNIKQFVWAFMLGGIGFLLYYFFVYAKPLLTFDFSKRLGNYFGNENEVARNISLITITCLYFAADRKKKIFYVPVFIGLWFAITTGSMSGIFLLFIILLLVIYLNVPKGKKWVFFMSLVALIIIAFLVLQTPALIYYKRRVYGIINTFLGIDTGSVDRSSSERLELSREAFLMFLRKPLFGFGPNQIAEFTSAGRYAHNNFTELLGNYGLFGLFFFELLLFVPAIRIRKQDTKYRSLILLVLMLVILSQFFAHPYTSKIEYFIIGFAFACVFDPNKKNISLEIGLRLIFPQKS